MDVGGFLYADVDEAGSKYEANEVDEDIVGLIVVSQTCDVVREPGDEAKNFVAVCPLRKCEEASWSAINRGRKPGLTSLEHPPEPGVFADLSRVMSVHKTLLTTWKRHRGFSTPELAERFAGALERKYGRFAFPDAFDRATKSFQDRVKSKHDKDSEKGRVYRSIEQLRFRATPDWNADQIEVGLLVIVYPPTSERPAKDDEIKKEIAEQIATVEWPQGYKWQEPKYVMATATQFSAEDIFRSQLADFEYLSA